MVESEGRALLPQEARLEDHQQERRATLHVSRFHYICLRATLCPASDILDAEAARSSRMITATTSLRWKAHKSSSLQ